MQEMHRAFRFNLQLFVLLSILVCFFQGCSHEQIEEITLGDWIQIICTRAQMTEYQSQTPYYLNITEENSYFHYVQSAVEWEILDTSFAFDENEALTKEWAAFTLVNLYRRDLNDAGNEISDLRNSKFPRHVSTAVSLGLMDVDKNGRFHPEDRLDANMAEEMLEHVLQYINNRTFETENIIEWNEEMNVIDDPPINVNEDEHRAAYPVETEIKKGDIIRYFDTDGNEQFQQVYEVQENEDNKIVFTEDPEIESTVDFADISDSFEIDFSNAEITDLQEMKSDISQNLIHTPTLMSANALQRTHHYKEWTIQYNINGPSIRAEIFRETIFGSKMYASASLTNVKPTYHWKIENGSISEGYFRVDFKTSESLGVRNAEYRTLYGDFTNISGKDFLNSVRNAFKPRNSMTDVEIPLAKIQVPVPNAPLLTVTVQLQLRVHIDGRCELSLSQNHAIGMEIHNGNMRVINEHDNKAEAMIRASTGIMLGLKFGMEAAKMKIADILSEGGARARFKTTLFLTDEEGNRNQEETEDIAADVLEELAHGNTNVRVCSEVHAFWVLQLTLNSSNTFAGRIGLSRTIPILDENNAKLIPGMKNYIENGQFVDRCSYSPAKIRKKKPQLEVDRIEVKNYSMILKEGETKQIEVTALPKNMKKEQIKSESMNPEIAFVDGLSVTGVKEGSTTIELSSKNQEYKIHIIVLIKKSS